MRIKRNFQKWRSVLKKILILVINEPNVNLSELLHCIVYHVKTNSIFEITVGVDKLLTTYLTQPLLLYFYCFTFVPLFAH